LKPRLRLPGPVLWTAVVSLLAVLFMTFVLPMGDGLDEAEHAFRAYQLALGHLYPQFISCAVRPKPVGCTGQTGFLVPHRRVGGYLDRSFYVVMHRLFRESLGRLGTHFDPQTYVQFFGLRLGGALTVFPHFENTILYSPVNYVPQTAVFWLARAFSAPALATFFIARLVAGLVWAALITWSVALMRRWRWLWSAAVLVPTALAQGPSLSADSVVFGVVAVALAYALSLAHAGEPLRRSQLARLAALGLVLGLLKFPIPLVLVAMLAIVWPLVGRGRARAGALGVIVAPALIGAAWWNLTINRYFLPYRNTVFNRPLRVNINQHAQIHHVLTHLIDVPGLFWNTLIAGRLLQLDELVGTYGTHILTGWVAAVWLVGFGALVLTTSERDRPPRAARVTLWLLLVICLLLTALVLYATWNAVGASTIEGVQGRYFTPLMVLLIPLLAGVIRLRRTVPEWVLPVGSMVLSGAGMIVLFEATSLVYYHQSFWQSVPRVVNVLF